MLKVISQKLSSKKATVLILFLGLYFLSSGVSLAVFSYLRGEPLLTSITGSLDEVRSKINLNLPRDQVCPINGAKFTKIEEDIWSKRRPMTAVIENHVDSRPPSGMSRADIVYEYVAEGGITRFLGVFYCGASVSDVRIGPIRSVRVYAVNLAAEYGESPLFIHSGGANNICPSCPGGVKPRGTVTKEVDAFALLADLGWRAGAKGNDLDAGTNTGYPEVWRDYERIPGAATEHTYMGSTDKLFDVGIKRGFGYKNADGEAWDGSFQPWKFVDDKPGGNVSKISFGFWDNKGDYDVVWDYDKSSNSYKRTNGGKIHKDLDNSQDLTAKNIVIQFVKERGPVDKEFHMFYEVVGSGKALYFMNGSVIEGTWKKSSITGRTKFFDDKGAEVSFVRGVTWVELIPTGNQINY